MIVIDPRYCKGCGICIHFCPKRILDVSKEVSARGYYVPCVIDEGQCTRCGQCELYCPDFAIFVVGEEDEEEKEKDRGNR